MVRSAPFPSQLLWGPDFTVVAFNEAFRPFLDAKPDPVGRSHLDVWPEIRDVVEPQLRRVMAGETLHFEAARFELERGQGLEEGWFDYGFSPVRDADGRVVGIVNTAVERTGQVRAEAALRASEARARADAERVQLALSAGAILGTWFWDLPADRFTVDEGFAQSFGIDPAYGREGLSLAQVVETVHPDDQAGLAAAIDEAIRRGGRYAHQYRVRRRDGRYYWIEANGEVRHAPDGTPLTFPGVLIDVEDRRQLEEARRVDEARLSAVLEALPVGVVITDAEGRLLRQNAAHRDLWGMEPGAHGWEEYGEWVGYWPDTKRRIEAREWTMARALLDGETIHGEMVEIEAFGTGDRRVLLNNAAAIRDGNGTIIGGVLAEQDVSDLRAVQQALSEALADKEALLYEVNHRVKNNLQVITSLLSMQASQSADDEVRRGLLDARARIGVIASIHQDLYTTSAHSSVEAVSFLGALAGNMMDSLGDGRIELRVTAEGERRMELSEAVPLSLVVSELLTNAVKYAFPGDATGIVAVDIRSDATGLSVTVADDGVGFPEGFNLFSPMGVGTRVISALSRQVRAEVEVLSRERGAAVRLFLPRR
jgi:PAS domain S-box-containing protein